MFPVASVMREIVPQALTQLLCCSEIRLGTATVIDNCESNAAACEPSCSAIAFKVRTACYDACAMREIGRQAHSDTHFVVFLQWNPSLHRACY